MPAASHASECEDAWDTFERYSTFYFNKRAGSQSWKRWVWCPADGYHFVMGPPKGHIASGSNPGSNCQMLAARREWAREHLDWREKEAHVRYYHWLLEALDEYREDTRRSKVHGKKLMRFVCRGKQ